MSGDNLMGDQKAWEDLYDSRQILKSSLRLFHSGESSAYRSVAIQLRLLLCDTQNPLLPRVCKQVKLHPLFSYHGNELDEGLVFQLPTMVSPPGKVGPETARLFDESRDPIDLEEWLNQPFISSDLTIRKLIKSVADKLAAHSDPKYGKDLEFLKSIALIDNPAHVKGIVITGEYILEQIEGALKEN